MDANSKAALLYIPPVLALLAVWYGLLFLEVSSDSSAIHMLLFTLSEGPAPNFFRWLLVLTFACAVLGMGHASPLTRKRAGRVSLFLVGAAIAVGSWLTVSIEVSVFATLPLLYAFRGAYRT